MSDISLTVLDDMRLFIEPEEIARDAEHNAAIFHITQPPTLDAYQCRAEVTTKSGTTYRLVTDHSFSLTNDIAVAGQGYLQLVYSNGTNALRKTRVAQFHVTPSLNAVDQSDPQFQDGLAQLQGAAFADADIQGTSLIFRNMGGTEIDRVVLPGSVEDLNAIYLRRDGTTPMQGSVQLEGPNRGVVFDYAASAAAIYVDTQALRIRKSAGNAPVTIEDNSGTATTRSAVLTEASGDTRYDARYLTQLQGDGRYVNRAGDLMTGPINTAYDGSNPAASSLVTRSYVDSRPIGITQPEADARYLSVNGGGVSGPLFMLPSQPFISAPGTGGNPMLCIGTNDSGFWRSGGTVIFEVGRTASWIYSGTNSTSYLPITLSSVSMTFIGTGNGVVWGNQARVYTNTGAVGLTLRRGLTQDYVWTENANGDIQSRRRILTEDDLATVPSAQFLMVADLSLTSAFQLVMSHGFNIPRGGNSRVMVTISGGLRFGGASQIGMFQVRISPGNIVRAGFAYSVDDGGVPEGTGVMLAVPVEVSGTNPQITIDMRMLGAAPLVLIGGSGDVQRTIVTFADMGAR